MNLSSSQNVRKFLFDVSFDSPEEIKENQRKQTIVKDDQNVNEEDRKEEKKEADAKNKVEEKLEPEVEKKVEPPPPMFTQKELDEASQTSYALGEAAGIKKNSQSTVALQTKAFELIAENLKKIDAAQKQNHEIVVERAVKLATAITKKMIPNIAKKYGEDEVVALIKQYLPQINKEKITLKVNPEQKHAIDMKIYELAKEAAYEGVINVIEDKTILAGDCQILWDNGEVEKNSQKIIDELDEIIEQNIVEDEKKVSE